MAGDGATPRIAVLASGQGSNLQALLDACADGRLHAAVVGVFSDRAGAPALARAEAAGVPAQSWSPADFADRAAFDDAVFAAVAAARPDVVVCAGYMRLIGADVVAPWQGRMVNIHPSLLPRFKGLRTHARALRAGARVHGASVHFVTGDLDGGAVIAQARVPVLAGDDVEALAARVRGIEHALLVAATALVCSGRAMLCDDRLHLDGAPATAPLQLTAKGGFA